MQTMGLSCDVQKVCPVTIGGTVLKHSRHNIEEIFDTEPFFHNRSTILTLSLLGPFGPERLLFLELIWAVTQNIDQNPKHICSVEFRGFIDKSG